ncbi:MAG TPA: LysR substrate-binding domain-containing protein, partial [Solirubrobacterales bacterium]|nr:LysR substrate-binding domain-containing protein [Solirubrobacterales bacterium]
TIEELDHVARDFWTLEAHRTGPLRVANQIKGFDEIFASVRAGLAVSVVPQSIGSRLPFPDIAVRPVSGLESATVALCWRQGDQNPLVSAFVECGKRLNQTA